MYVSLVPMRTILGFTGLQLACFAALYFISILLKIIWPGQLWTSVSVVFPLMVILYCVPLRSHILPAVMRASDLAALDPESGIVVERDPREVRMEDVETVDRFIKYAGRGSQSVRRYLPTFDDGGGGGGGGAGEFFLLFSVYAEERGVCKEGCTVLYCIV